MKNSANLFMIQDIFTKKGNINCIVFQNYFGKFQYSKENHLITYEDKVQFYISSAIPEFIQYLMKTSILSDVNLRLWNQKIKIESVEVIQEPKFSGKCEVTTLSPITVYSTFQNQFRKKIYYYDPKEPEFYELIKQNIIKKYIAFYGQEPEDKTFQISSIQNQYRQRVIKYKNQHIIKAYDGNFIIKGNPKLIELAYQTGLSGKNSIGFGMIQVKEGGVKK